MEQEKPKPYITNPRFLASDFKSGKITRNELLLLLWLRLNTNPFGILTVNLSAIQEDIFYDTKNNNYANKLMLSLLSKRYLYYENRQGRRGSFEVHFGDWLLPNKTIRNIDHCFNQGEVRSESGEMVKDSVEVSHKLKAVSQKSNDNNIPTNNIVSGSQLNREVRSHYNDNDKDKEKDDIVAFKGIMVDDFRPESYQELRCQEIAKELGEEHINFLLSIKKKYGFGIIEKAWGLYREDRDKGKKIVNPPAYFQGIIKQTLIDNNRK